MDFLARIFTSLLLALLILAAGFAVHVWRNPRDAYDRAR